MTHQKNPVESWETEFREYFDKSLKPKKSTMINLDRELCVDFIKNLLSSHHDQLLAELDKYKCGKHKKLRSLLLAKKKQ